MINKAIGYVRVSTEKQETARQLEMVMRYAAANGYILIHMVEEPTAVSGRSVASKGSPGQALEYYAAFASRQWSRLERPGFRDILQMVADGAADTVIVYALDRMSRDTVELLLLELTLRSMGARLICINAGSAIDTGTATGLFTFRVMAAAAEMECNQISERTGATLKQKQEAGIQVGRPPRGWRRNGDSFTVDPAIWPMVKEVGLRRSTGHTFAEIARELNLPESKVRRLWKSYNWQPRKVGVRNENPRPLAAMPADFEMISNE